MVEIPPHILAAFGVPPRDEVELGDVFDLRPPHVEYFDATYGRPAVVVAVDRSRDGRIVRAYLLYTTTKSVPRSSRIDLARGEGGMRKPCWLDLRRYKEIESGLARRGEYRAPRIARRPRLPLRDGMAARVRGPVDRPADGTRRAGRAGTRRTRSADRGDRARPGRRRSRRRRRDPGEARRRRCGGPAARDPPGGQPQ
jgi:hypothetical protein